MNVMLRKWIFTPVRNYCQITNEEALVIQELIKKVEACQVKKSDWKTVLAGREWAIAPIVEVNGRMPMAHWQRSTKSGAKNFSDDVLLQHAVVKIRWNEKEKRDLNILLGGNNNMYSVEVKAVMYGILSAIHWGEKKVRMRSTNDIVVKVANDKFKANKETTMFECIKKYVTNHSAKKNNRLLVKLDKMSSTDRQAVQNANAQTITESEFFKRYRESIDKMKSDL